MKAVEYANQYRANPIQETVGKIALAMLIETQQTAKIRNAVTGAALVTILKESIQKWQAFARLTDNVQTGNMVINPDGLKLLIVKEFPFIPEYMLN